jgi:hypothetical protein
MTKDAVATMGDILPDDAWGRDAVHVAVFLAYSTETLKPSQHVGIVNEEGGKDMRVTPGQTVGRNARTGHIGIVDPFLEHDVPPGQRFWCYLYPRTITALSHKWSHPAFGEPSDSVYAPPADKLASENWLRDFSETLISYEDDKYDCLIRYARYRIENDADSDHFYIGTDIDVYEVPSELWHHLEVVLGQKIPGKKPQYFRCAC